VVARMTQCSYSFWKPLFYYYFRRTDLPSLGEGEVANGNLGEHAITTGDAEHGDLRLKFYAEDSGQDRHAATGKPVLSSVVSSFFSCVGRRSSEQWLLMRSRRLRTKAKLSRWANYFCLFGTILWFQFRQGPAISQRFRAEHDWPTNIPNSVAD
jgi:hypothetical protein